MAVYWLDEHLWFPDPHEGEDNGLIAVGGDLSLERLLLAYSNGIFPWFSFHYREYPHWYCPLDRFVIFPKDIHISHSMKQLIRQERYQVTFNQDFEGVIRGCSIVDDRNQNDGAWLGPEMINAYTELHKRGYAASVEVWDPKVKTDKGHGMKLVGGLYGVVIRHAFFGESMFSLVPNASKLALIYLAQALIRLGGLFIDCQFETSHLKSMGGKYISYDQYMQILNTQELL